MASTVGGMSTAADDGMAPSEVDPMDFLASLLRLSPEDAERVRNATPEPDDSDRDHGSNRYGDDD
jgi:hypothetical protein